MNTDDAAFEAFLKLHSRMPRQGPGEIGDVGWAARLAGVARDARLAGVARDARLADMGCGPGADFLALSALVPDGHVLGIDATPALVAEARVQAASLPNVTVHEGDMLAPEGGPFDFIWSAGAVYNVGIEPALTAWRGQLAPGGVAAFSELHWRVPAAERPAEATAFWAQGYPAMTDAQGIGARIAAAGWRLLGTRLLCDAAWEAYYSPLEARIARLRPGADAVLSEVLDEDAREIALWRAHRDAFGYLLCVVAPA
jgi:SAM-dependent methyltransferase